MNQTRIIRNQNESIEVTINSDQSITITVSFKTESHNIFSSDITISHDLFIALTQILVEMKDSFIPEFHASLAYKETPKNICGIAKSVQRGC